MSVIKRLILSEFTLWGRDLVSVIRIRESPYYRGFLKKICDKFVETLETVRNREVSVPRGSTVFLFFFDGSFSLLSYFIFQMYIENHIKNYFGRHIINSNTVGSRVGRSRGYKLRSIGEKTPKLSYMCAFHGVK